MKQQKENGGIGNQLCEMMGSLDSHWKTLGLQKMGCNKKDNDDKPKRE